MKVRELLEQAIKQAGGDGLCCPHEECGCGLDDLAPCVMFDVNDCRLAKKVYCKDCDETDVCWISIDAGDAGHCYIPINKDKEVKQ